jgi:ABC-2 type transport system ATP-binding protein
MGAVSPSAVEVKDLVKVYARGGGGTLRALDGISFRVAAGEFFGFLGPNGAGKTTALEIIEGIRKPSAGQVQVLGVDPRKDLDRVKRMIGVQLQAASYFSLLTITEILELFGSFYPKRRRPDELLEIVGLQDKARSYVRHLSGVSRGVSRWRPHSSTTPR